MAEIVKLQYGFEVDKSLEYIPLTTEDLKQFYKVTDPQHFNPFIHKHNCELYFIFDDGTFKYVSIYEPHGWFEFEGYYIVYGHENIKIYNKEGKELHNQHTR